MHTSIKSYKKFVNESSVPGGNIDPETMFYPETVGMTARAIAEAICDSVGDDDITVDDVVNKLTSEICQEYMDKIGGVEENIDLDFQYDLCWEFLQRMGYTDVQE